MGRLGAGLFLAVHALITGAIWIPPQRELAGFGPRASWLFAGNRPTMVTLAVTASAAFALAAIGMFGHQEWWAPAAILGALVSLALITATFTPLVERRRRHQRRVDLPGVEHTDEPTGGGLTWPRCVR